MCALRDYRSIPAVSLACQYRLDLKPKRPEPKTVTRKKKKEGSVGDKPETPEKPRVQNPEEDYHYLQRMSIIGVDEWEDFDFDADDDYCEVFPQLEELSQRYYIGACQELGVKPIKVIHDGLVEDDLVCKGTKLITKDVKACTIALLSNSICETMHFEGNDMGQEAGRYIGEMMARNNYFTDISNSICETMHFEGNDMGQEAGRYIGEMMVRNNYFTDITISWNNIGSLGAEAVCAALLKNNNVRRLDLTGNKFKESDGLFFKELLEENSAIRELYLGHNYFRELGGEHIAEGLGQNFFLETLDLSWNHLRMKGAMAIGKALTNNNQLEVLNIAWNGFHIHGIVFLAEALKKNHCLLDLDISCNRLSEMCVLQFLSGLEKNSTLKKLRALKKNHCLLDLDISCNRLSEMCILQFLSGLEKNSTLKKLRQQLQKQIASITINRFLLDLDISCNRLSEMCILQFLSGLEKNSTLKKLRLGRNHITHVGALKILEHIKAHPSIALEYIDMGHQHVHDDFVQILDEIKEKRKFDVDYGMVWTGDRDPIGKQDETEDEVALLNENPHFILMEFMRLQKLRLDETEDEVALLNENPHFVLMEFMRLQKLRLVDLFHQMDKDNSKGISVQEFQLGLEAVSIPLKKVTLEKFVNACDSNKNGEIEYIELLEANKAYKEALRNIVRSNVPFEQTDLGRIQKLMRKIMITAGSIRPPPVTV